MAKKPVNKSAMRCGAVVASLVKPKSKKKDSNG